MVWNQRLLRWFQRSRLGVGDRRIQAVQPWRVEWPDKVGANGASTPLREE